MASSSNRKSNSSASRASRSTYRRANSQSDSANRRRTSGTRSNTVALARHGGGASQRRKPSVVGGGYRPQPRTAPTNVPRGGYRTVSARSSQQGSRRSGRGGQNVASRLGTVAGRLHMPHIGAPAVVGVLGTLLVAIVVAVIVINSGLFAATDIQIKGSEHMSAKDARLLIDLPEGTSLFNVNEKQIVDDLQQNPWISGVSVTRTFPHTLTITPTEHTVKAIAYIAADDLAWAIDENDTWIAPLSVAALEDTSDSSSSDNADSTDASTSDNTVNSSSAQSGTSSDSTDSTSGSDASTQTSSTNGSTSGSSSDSASGSSTDSTDTATGSDADSSNSSDQSKSDASNSSGLLAAQKLAKKYGAVLLIDVPTDITPVSGETVKSDVIKAGLAYVKGFSSDFLKQVKDISVSSTEAISIDLKSGVEVSVGSADKIERKEKIVTRLLSQEDGVTYINVRTPGSYTFRQAPAS